MKIKSNKNGDFARVVHSNQLLVHEIGKTSRKKENLIFFGISYQSILVAEATQNKFIKNGIQRQKFGNCT